jgi:hypothetical protein
MEAVGFALAMLGLAADVSGYSHVGVIFVALGCYCMGAARSVQAR